MVSEHEICLLACPPNENLEDKNMNDTIHTAADDGVPAQLQEAGAADTGDSRLTVGDILSRIDLILRDTAYIHEAIEAIQKMEPGEPSLNAPDPSRQSIATLIQAREATNQQMIHLLEKMYDDVKPREPSEDGRKLRELSDALSRYPEEFVADVLRKAAQQMFVRAGAEIVT